MVAGLNMSGKEHQNSNKMKSSSAGLPLGMGRLISAASQSVMLIWLASRSTPLEAGTTLTWYTIAVVLASVSDLGIGSLTLLSVTKSNQQKAKQLYTVGLLSGVIVFLITSASAALMGMSATSLFVVLGLLLWAQLDRLADLGFMFDIAESKNMRVGVLTGGRRMAALAIFLALEGILRSDVAFIVSLLTSSALAFIIFGKAHTRVHELNRADLFALISELRPYLFNSLLSQLRALEAPLLTVGGGQARTAAYTLGVRLTSPVLMLYGSSGVAVLGSGRSLGRKEIKSLLIFTAALGLVCISLGLSAGTLQPIAAVFIPWLSASDVAVIFLVGLRTCVWGLSGIFSMNLIGQDKVITVTKVNSVFIASTLAVSFLGPFIGLSVLIVAIVSTTLGIAQVAIFVHINNQLRSE
jgi:O-antigen/teichoic acid export membrane protein